MATLLLLIPLAVPLGLFAPNFVGIVTTGADPFPGDDLAPGAPQVELDHEPPRYRNFTRSLERTKLRSQFAPPMRPRIQRQRKMLFGLDEIS